MAYRFEELPPDISCLIDDDFISLFMAKTAHCHSTSDIAETLGWLDDGCTGWWYDCVHETCDDLSLPSVWEIVGQMEWFEIDAFAAELSVACREFAGF